MDRRPATALVVVALVALLAACGGVERRGAERDATPEVRSSEPQDGPGVLSDAETGFRIEAPAGFGLDVRDGVYVLEGADRSLSYSRLATAAAPGAFGDALLRQLGGTVVTREGDAQWFQAEADGEGARDTVLVLRGEDGLTIVTGRSPLDDPLSLELLRQVAATAEGGVVLQPPGGGEAATLPLEPYRAPDGGATGLVPSGAEWDIQSGQGVLQGFSPRGAFRLGFTIQPLLPESVPGGDGQGAVVAPYLDAATALTDFYPTLAPGVTDIRIRRVLREPVLPAFSSSAMFEFDFALEGRPWVGVATVATDSPQNYGGFVWGFYYSGIAVPAGSDPSVGAGLLRVWREWDPGGAIAQRSQQAKELLDASNDVWRETSEFRAETADRQARDVGCLLQGYYDIEDNSREYDLPPAPCGQEYTGDDG